MHKQLDELFQKEMSRKEFLAAVGFGLASIFGFAHIIRAITGKTQKSNARGYGSSPYGQ